MRGFVFFVLLFFMQGCDNSLFDNPGLGSSYKEFETDRKRLKMQLEIITYLTLRQLLRERFVCQYNCIRQI